MQAVREVVGIFFFFWNFHVTWKFGQDDFSGPLQFLNFLTHFNGNVSHIMI